MIKGITGRVDPHRDDSFTDLKTSPSRSALYMRLQAEAQEYGHISYADFFAIIGSYLRLDKAGAREVARLLDALGIIHDNHRGLIYLHAERIQKIPAAEASQ